MSYRMPHAFFLAFLLSLVSACSSLDLRAQEARANGPTPVVVDFDIGSDIDDAFALAMVLRSPALRLEAVTTVSGDTAARARIAAKMLAVAGKPTVPVAAGPRGPGSAMPQAAWAADFRSPAMVGEPAVAVLHEAVLHAPDRLVLIALGPLSNLAALFTQFPDDRRHVRAIVLMGGSFARGYEPGSGAIAESNIASDIPAAKAIFASGVPLVMAPLDITAATQMNAHELEALFAHRTPLTEALRQLYQLWGQPVPTLHDPTAVALLLNPALCTTQPVHVDIGDDGRTRIVATLPANARVGFQMQPEAFVRYYGSLFDGR